MKNKKQSKERVATKRERQNKTKRKQGRRKRGWVTKACRRCKKTTQARRDKAVNNVFVHHVFVHICRPPNQVHGFPSNNAVATKRRGHPRPGRKKQAMSRGCRACSSHEQPEEVNEGAEEVNEGAEESQEDDESILGSVFELPLPENNEDESYYMPYDPYSGYWAVPSEALVWWPSDALAPGNWTMVVMPKPGAYEETYINPPYMPPRHPSNRRPDWRGRRGLLTASGRPNT